jgi:flagellar biosynthetic protein FliR
MFSDLVPYYPLLVPFLLVVFRVLGIFAFVPLFSNAAIPGNVKVLLGLAIAVCVWNVVPRPVVLPEDLLGVTAAIIGELSVGLLIGLLTGLIFMGIQMGAHMISQQMGLAMATVYDPMFSEQSTVIEQLAFWIALVGFLTMGGHREIINAVVYSYREVPMGQAVSPEVALKAILGVMDTSFHAAARVAMPALVAFFIATLTAGLISRSMPQMNLMTLGININLLVGFVMIAVGLTGWALVATDSFQKMFHTISRALGG